jgi:peptidoglycan/xylan/chitin deacetylase (PgdA/CDA1 family)
MAQNSGSTNTLPREVAVTFDDLPFVSVARQDIETYRETTTKLLRSFNANKVPVIGFVNERKLGQSPRETEARTALLQMWLDAGLELGNHTFSHPDLHTMPLADYEADIVRGETVTRELLNRRGMKLRFFRHPFLHTGRSLETKRSLESFLAGRGYRIAPVTIDNSEWIFAAAYAKALSRGDREMAQRVADAYIPYMEQKFAYHETESTKLFGREVKQVLLLHANALNADHFNELAAMMKKRGYKFITLEEALTDEAYKSLDTFTGAGGISWLDRWALTEKKSGDFFRGEPRTPEFVMKEAGVKVE